MTHWRWLALDYGTGSPEGVLEVSALRLDDQLLGDTGLQTTLPPLPPQLSSRQRIPVLARQVARAVMASSDPTFSAESTALWKPVLRTRRQLRRLHRSCRPARHAGTAAWSTANPSNVKDV